VTTFRKLGVVRTARFALIVAAVLANAPRVAKSQPVAGPPPPTVIGSLGLSDIECNCTFNSGETGESRIFRFRSNPVVLRVRPGSPSSGILQRGDTLVDIDGVSLRSVDGGRRFANVRPGVRVVLGVRRDGRYIRATVIPAAVTRAQASQLGEYSPRVPRPGDTYDEDDEWSPPTTPALPRAPRAVRPPHSPFPSTPPTPTPPVVPVSPASPRGWFGFSIRCNDCGWSRIGHEQYPRWESTTHPEVTRVAPDGPAAAAGIRSGDLVTHVDGISILTPEGGRRFGALQPGQRVRLGLLRNGAVITRELRLESRPGFSSTTRPLRYTGRLRDVSVEVWSPAGPTVEQIGDTLVITIGNSVVRLKASGKR
jgi:hypothetical protein